MQKLPLYPDSLSVIETTDPLETNSNCELCSFHAKAKKTICMSPEGDPGGILFVADYPGKEEDLSGRPLIGKVGRFFRNIVEKYYDGPYAIDNAVKCSPGKKPNRQQAFKHVNKCRGYLADTLLNAKPKRIITLGPWAAYAVLGRSFTLFSTRKSYAFLSDGTPVFICISPVNSMYNRFVRSWFEEDLKWAITTKHPDNNYQGIAHIIETQKESEEACEEISTASWFAFDVETAGDMFGSDFEVLSIACTAEGESDSWVWGGKALKDPIIKPLRQLFLNPNIDKVAHNAPFDLKAIRRLDIDLITQSIINKGGVIDTLVYRRLDQADAEAKLETAIEIVGMGGHKEEAKEHLAKAIRNARRKKPEPFPKGREWCAEAIQNGKPPKQYAFGLLPKDVLDRYNALDTVGCARLKEKLEESLEKRILIWNSWKELLEPGIPAISQVEDWGIAVSKEHLDNFIQYLHSNIDLLSEKFKAYGEDFNPNASGQVSDLLFKKLKLKPYKFTATKRPSTDKETLTHLLGKHPVVKDLLEWRSLNKIDGSFASGMLEHIREDGRIHPSYKIVGTETARLSCSQPNLQAIRRPEDQIGKMTRDIFTATPGNLLIQFDYSQLEYRVAAILSKDPVMAQAFIDGEDFHLRTAKLIAPIVWGITADQVQKKHRSFAKQVNFGLIFGMSDNGLAAKLGCTVEMAKKIRAAILGQFRKYAAWIKSQLYYGKKHGGVWVPWTETAQRWRPLWKLDDNNAENRNNAEIGTYNTPIQGYAALFCLASLSECVRWIIKENIPAKLPLTVHDSLIFDVDKSAINTVINKVDSIMTQWDTGSVPLVVDKEIGKSWGSLKKYDDWRKENAVAA